ncbi:hypothetical protein HYV84_02470 [Candidatus Woesearchaeota archaeon]|nr:hypothetical protein [Candidatus Woesearchaeota archaeon]
MAKNQIQLSVAEAIIDDVGKSLVRIDESFIKEIGAKEGEVIAVDGGKKTFALTKKGYPGDFGTKLIRMDRKIRGNVRVVIGDQVKVSKAKLPAASKVVIGNGGTGIEFRGVPELFGQCLAGKPFSKGDSFTLSAPESQQRYSLTESLFFKDLLGGMEDYFKPEADLLQFKILDIVPNSGGIIGPDTKIIFKKGAQEQPLYAQLLQERFNLLREEMMNSKNVPQLEKLKRKVLKAEIRISPKAIKTFDKLKARLLKEIEKKGGVLGKKNTNQ